MKSVWCGYDFYFVCNVVPVFPVLTPGDQLRKHAPLRCWHLATIVTSISIYFFILTRFAIQAKGPDGKWTRKPLAYRESNNVHLLIARPPEICVNLVFKHIHAASSYTICRQFVPFIYCPL